MALKKLPLRDQERYQKQLELTEEFKDGLSLLILSWANCENWLIHVLAKLLGVGFSQADVVFFAFNSNRARLELIDRAAVMFLLDARQIRHIRKLLRGFKSVTAMRNMLCHAEYTFDSKGAVVTGLLETNYGRTNFDGANTFEHRILDKGLLNEIRQAHKKAMALMGSFERFAKNAIVLSRLREQPLLPEQLQKKKRAPQRPQKGRTRGRPQPPSRRK